MRRVRPRRTPKAPAWTDRLAPLILLASVVGGGTARAWIALTDDGMYWSDEIYQSLEPAHRLVYGPGLVSWEFLNGARNWAFPGLVAGLMKLAELLGLNEPRGYIAFEKLAFVAIALLTVVGTYRLARAFGASAFASACGASVFALGAMPIYFGPRALSENASALVVVFGLALALAPGGGRAERIGGAALIALSLFVRLQNGIFAAGLLVALAARRERLVLLDTVATFGVVALVYGAMDQITWGSPFRSAIANIELNVSLAADPKLLAIGWYSPPTEYYATAFASAMGLVAAATVVLAAVGAGRTPWLAMIIGAYVAIHSAIPHKELRFMVPAVPALAALAGIGVDEVARRAPRARWRELMTGSLLLAVAVASAIGFHALRFSDLGLLAGRELYDENQVVTTTSPDESAYDDPGGVNRLLRVAGTQPDVCGIKVEVVRPEFQGGYTYLHRAVPLYRAGGPARASGYFNYTIALRSRAGAGEIRATDGAMALVRVRADCVPDPAFSDRL